MREACKISDALRHSLSSPSVSKQADGNDKEQSDAGGFGDRIGDRVLVNRACGYDTGNLVLPKLAAVGCKSSFEQVV